MLTILSAVKSIIAMENSDIMIVCIAVCAAIGALVGLLTVIIKQKQLKSSDKKQRSDIIENPQSSALNEEQAYYESNGSLVMSRNVIYSVGVDGQLKAGKYTLECAHDATAKFNARINGLVREYEGGDVVTLTDGDTVSPVSCSVIISPFGE